jgi:hypothetical protein
MSVARLRLAPVRETRFPPRAPFFRDRLSARCVAIAAANAEEKERGNLPVSPYAPSTAHRPETG